VRDEPITVRIRINDGGKIQGFFAHC
jgi:hypothetical protein